MGLGKGGANAGGLSLAPHIMEDSSGAVPRLAGRAPGLGERIAQNAAHGAHHGELLAVNHRVRAGTYSHKVVATRGRHPHRGRWSPEFVLGRIEASFVSDHAAPRDWEWRILDCQSQGGEEEPPVTVVAVWIPPLGTC